MKIALGTFCASLQQLTATIYRQHYEENVMSKARDVYKDIYD